MMTEPPTVLDHDPPSPALGAAWSLATSLRDGCHLAPLSLDGVPLAGDEPAYAELDVTGWRWLAVDGVAYESRTFLLGGPLLMCATAIASAVGNGRRRRDAERAAAPQWRPLGVVRVVVTPRRLLVRHESSWWSVWFEAIASVHPDPAALRLDVVFDRDPPYRFEGPEVPVLAVVLLWLSSFDGREVSSKA
jgi:hypothetical protein